MRPQLGYTIIGVFCVLLYTAVSYLLKQGLNPEIQKAIIYSMIACQLLAWGWFSIRAGKVSDRGFMFFTTGMLFGQLGAGVETFQSHAWGTLVVQVYFFAFTAYGGYKRYKLSRIRA